MVVYFDILNEYYCIFESHAHYDSVVIEFWRITLRNKWIGREDMTPWRGQSLDLTILN